MRGHSQMSCNVEVFSDARGLYQAALPGQLGIDQIHDRSLAHRRSQCVVRNEISYSSRVPVVASGQAITIIESLHHRPLAVGVTTNCAGDLKAVGNRVVINACSKPTGSYQSVAIETTPLSNLRNSLGVLRSVTRAADVDTEFIGS